MRFEKFFWLRCILCSMMTLSLFSQAAAADTMIQSTKPEYLLFKEAFRYQTNGNFEEALSTYQKAAEYDPNECSPYIHLNLGILFSKKGVYSSAIEEFKKVLQQDPTMHEALLNLGSAYQATGKLRSAQKCFRSYLELPNAPEKQIVQRLLNAVSSPGNIESGSQRDSSDYLANVISRGIGIWPLGAMPIRVYIAQGDGITGFRPYYADKLCEAFNDWTRASEGRLSWLKVTNPNDANVICGWTADQTELGESGAEGGSSTLKFWPGQGSNKITSSSILLLTHELGSANEVSPVSIKRRCLHEVGHTLGLSGHSPDNSDVMFFTEAETIGHSPSDRDVTTLLKLYRIGGNGSSGDFAYGETTQQTPKPRRSYVPPNNSYPPQQTQPNNRFDWRNQVRQNLRQDRESSFFSE